MENLPQSRRTFITTLTLLFASGGLLARYLTPRTTGRPELLVSAALADVPHNGALVFSKERVALIRSDSGLSAVSLVCTHLGCTVAVTEDTFSCPCHGSVFDRRGNVLKGPASQPLRRLQVVEKNGVAEVYGA
jgi:Rieske Fe-S protein